MLKFVLLVIVVTVAVYLTVRLIQRRGLLEFREPPRKVAPDDDPDFLRELERRRRHPEDPDA